MRGYYFAIRRNNVEIILICTLLIIKILSRASTLSAPPGIGLWAGVRLALGHNVYLNFEIFFPFISYLVNVWLNDRNCILASINVKCQQKYIYILLILKYTEIKNI